MKKRNTNQTFLSFLRARTFAIFISSFFFFGASARAETFLPESIFLTSIEPGNRVSFGIKNLELNEPKIFARDQTALASAEYAFSTYFSLYAGLPYSRRWYTDLETTRHIDNAPVGLKLAYPGSNFMPAAGLNLYLPTGNDRLRIGSKEFGNVEPYAALAWKSGSFSLQGMVKYNSQSNRGFYEKPGQKFIHTWYAEASAGFRFSFIQIIGEISRKMVVDPEEKHLNTTLFSPGIGFTLGDSGYIGIGIPYSLSKEREYDAGFIIKGIYYY